MCLGTSTKGGELSGQAAMQIILPFTSGVEVHKGMEGKEIVFVNAACRDHRNPLPIIVDLKNSN